NNLKSQATALQLAQGWREENNLSLDCMTSDVSGRCTQADVDWFQFNLAGVGLARQFVRIDSSPLLGDLDAVLMDDNGVLRGQSAGGGSREQISLEDLPAGNYFIGVYGVGGAANPSYALTIDARPSIPKDGFEDNNSRGTATNLQQVVGLRTFAAPVYQL